MPAYSASIALPSITAALVSAQKALNRAGDGFQKGFANAIRPREGFIRPSSVDLEQNLRDGADKITNLRIRIVTGETSDSSEGLQASTRKTARFESSFGGFQIF